MITLTSRPWVGGWGAEIMGSTESFCSSGEREGGSPAAWLSPCLSLSTAASGDREACWETALGQQRHPPVTSDKVLACDRHVFRVPTGQNTLPGLSLQRGEWTCAYLPQSQKK